MGLTIHQRRREEEKWVHFFDANPREEDEPMEKWFRRLYKRAGVQTPSTLKNKYHRFVKNSKIDPKKDEPNNTCRILVFDIETAPLKTWVWGKWKQFISDDQIIDDWFVLCWSAKWLFEDKYMTAVIRPDEVKNQDDRRIVKLLWDKMNEADVVIAHNGAKFDIKKINTRFLFHSMNPPLPYQVIDTLLHLRNQFANTSNRLDAINAKLNLNRKLDHEGFDLWVKCCDGDKDALRRMGEYCQQDIKALEDLYLRIRPWIQPHPNIGLFIADNVTRCPSCGSKDLTWDGDYTTTVNVFSAFRCKSCGSIGRSRKSSIPLAKKGSLPMSVPKSR